MTVKFRQEIPGPNTPLVDRFRVLDPRWYQCITDLYKIMRGIAEGNLIVPGAITTDLLAAGAVTTEILAAGAATIDKLDAENLDVLEGIFGNIKTNETATRIEIDSAANELKALISGVQVLTLGGAVADTVFELFSSFAALYGAKITNTSTTGGGSGNGGGALFVQSVGGFTVEVRQSATTAGALGTAAIAARNTGTSGGHGFVGCSLGSGSFAFRAISGGYSPFTGQHDGLLANGSAAYLTPGDILVDGPVLGRKLSDCITEVLQSTAADQPAIGIFERCYDSDCCPPALLDHNGGPLPEWETIKANYDMAVVNSLGEGCVNVCGENGDIQKGDLIVTSNTPGKGMRQADDIVRAKTVARARETITFNGAESKPCACIYLCG